MSAAPSNRVNIFTDAYLISLTQSPVKTLQTTVPFENDIPSRSSPEQPLGQAMKLFYDNTIYQRVQPLSSATLAQHLLALNSALDAIPQDVRIPCKLRKFTEADYKRVLEMRSEALERKHKTAELDSDKKKQSFWGSNRQLLFGKVVTDIFAANCPNASPLHLFGAIFCSPCGGIIGPDTHNLWAEFIGKKVLRYSQRVLNYHSVCHDASGYCRNALDIGAGYTYIESRSHVIWALSGGWAWSRTVHPSQSPLAGQLDGCHKWKKLLNE